jgi:hypothetical protein
MTEDEELLAVALWVKQAHGAAAPVFIAERIGALALQGDAPGIERWKAIASTFQSLGEGAAH